MNLRTHFMVILVFLSILAGNAFAGVYKHVNPDGSVEFTDVPNKIGQKPVEVAPPSTYSPPPVTPIKSAETKTTATDYESVSIASPANDVSIRSNDGSLSISVVSKPGLQAGDVYVLTMDGQKAGESTGGSFKLTNVDRGSHTLTVQIVREGETLVQSQGVTVHLHRASLIQKKK